MLRAALATCVALCLTTPAAAQDATAPVDRENIALAEYVTEDLAYYGDVPSMAALRTLVAKSSWGRCFSDKRVLDFLTPALDELGEATESLRGLLGFDLNRLPGLFAGRGQLAVRERFVRGRTVMQGAMLLRAPAIEGFLEPLIRTSEHEEVQIGRHLAYRFDIDVEGMREFGPTVLVAMFEDHLLVTNSMRWAAAIVGDKPLEEKSFAKSEAFAALPKAPIVLWTDPGQLFRTDEQRYGKEIAAVRAATAARLSGFSAVQPSVTTIALEDGRFVERYTGAVPAADTPAAKNGTTATGFTLLDRVSADTTFVIASRVDMRAFLQAFHDYVGTGTHADDIEQATADEELAETVIEFLDRFHETGLFTRLAAGLGDECIVTAAAPRSGFVPTMLARAAIGDREKLVAALDDIVEKPLTEGVTLEKKSGGLYILRLASMPISIVFGVGERELVTGLNAGVVRTGMRPPARALVSDARFREAMATVGASDLQTVSSIGYIDVPRWIEFGYEAIIPLIDMFGDKISLDPTDAPSVEHVAGIFTPTAGASRVDGDRWTVEIRGPFAPLSAVTAMMAAPLALIDHLAAQRK